MNFTSLRKLKLFIHLQESSNLKSITITEHKIIDIIYRNYDPFLFSWLGVNGTEYLLCGLDYQGYSIVNLSNKETNHYVPEEAYKGMDFAGGK